MITGSLIDTPMIALKMGINVRQPFVNGSAYCQEFALSHTQMMCVMWDPVQAKSKHTKGNARWDFPKYVCE